MSNSLNPDQAQQNVWPDLGPNCLQSFQQTTRVGRSLHVNKAVHLCLDCFSIYQFNAGFQLRIGLKCRSVEKGVDC